MHSPVLTDRPWALVEIGSEMDEAERAELIRAAYLSSRAGVVVLVLRGVSPRSVDRVLDEVVNVREGGIRGVVYLNGDDEPAVLAAAANAAHVIASTERFRLVLDERGIPVVESTERARILSPPTS